MSEQRDPGSPDGRTVTTVQPDELVDHLSLGAQDTIDEVSTSRKGALIGLGVVILAVLTLIGFALAPRDQTAEAAVTGQQLSADPVGDLAPDFDGTLVDGSGSLALSSLRGKTVVVNFWASWCSTCKEEAQIVADTEKQWRAKGVVFVGVDSHDTKAGAATYVQTYGLGYASVQDPDSTVTARYNVTGLPETFFLDSKGRIVAKYVSAIDAVTLNSLIRKAVAAG